MKRRWRILIVEDDPLVSKTLETMVKDLGHRVIGIANNAIAGLSMASSLSIDIAIVDVNLGEGTSRHVVGILDERAVPTVIYSGSDINFEPAFVGRSVVQKPLRRHVLSSAIENAMVHRVQ
jgi:DNA-binding NarL/FixJ family response regulator